MSTWLHATNGDCKPLHVECGCSRRYKLADFAALQQVGLQKVEGGGVIALANCVCGSTLSMEVA